MTKAEWITEKSIAKAFAVKKLSSQNKQIVVKALQYLEWEKNQEYEKKIIALLTDEDFMVRAEAAANLWHLDIKEAPQSYWLIY